MITIAAEVVAVILITFVGGFFSKNARWLLTVIFGRLLDIDVEHAFRNKREAEEDIRMEIDRASFVYLLTGRGNELQRASFLGPLTASPRKIVFKILLPEMDHYEHQTDWILQREKELSSFDPAYGDGLLAKQIETNINFLAGYVRAGNVEVKRYNYPHIGRVIITDRVAYFSPYRKDAHGRESRVIKYRRGGDMYDFFSRFFNQFWENLEAGGGESREKHDGK